ncbi:hypothetical protein [Vibrio splendidus]|uniref:hypothetical protein n=1 Tax=Vibrio splendidus TaxID=29497 RepID=UPI003D11F5DE
MNFEKTMNLEKVKGLVSDLNDFWSNDDLSNIEFFSLRELELHLYKSGFASELSRLNVADPLSDDRHLELKKYITEDVQHRKTLKCDYDIRLIVAALENEPAFANSKDTIFDTYSTLRCLSFMVELNYLSIPELHAMIRHYEFCVPVAAFFEWMGDLLKKVNAFVEEKDRAKRYVQQGLVVTAIHGLTSGDANELDVDTLYTIGINTEKTFVTTGSTDVEKLMFNVEAGWRNEEYQKWQMNEYCLPYNNKHATTDLIEVQN